MESLIQISLSVYVQFSVLQLTFSRAIAVYFSRGTGPRIYCETSNSASGAVDSTGRIFHVCACA